MTRKELAGVVTELLKKEYPEVKCTLEYSQPHEMLFATQMSAQCTDARVNIVTETLFSKYPTLEAFASADLSELEQDVKPCGFYRTKAKSIIEMANRLIDVYDSRIPDTMEELLTLSGVGRKTANLVVGDVYGKPAVVTDTHVIRITNLLGLCNTKDPYKVELKLRQLLPPEESNDFCHRTVLHGREICTARKAYCERCTLADICKKNI